MAEKVPVWNSLRKSFYGIAIVTLLLTVAWYSFLLVQNYRYTWQLTNQQLAIDSLSNEIELAKNNKEYVKYVAAQWVVQTQGQVAWWWDRLSRVMSVFTTLQGLWGGANVRFSDFALDFSVLHLKGTVSNLQLVYMKSWIIDKFNELWFLKNINITDYKKTEDGYAFTLVADVVLQNVWN